MARPEIQPHVEGGEEGEGHPAGTGVVRPGTGVVRPATGVVAPADAAAAKARVAVPDAPERPLEPIHIVLPVIPVKPVKQGFLDRLVAPKPKKPKVDKAEKAEKAQKAEKAEKVEKSAKSRRVDAEPRPAAEEPAAGTTVAVAAPTRADTPPARPEAPPRPEAPARPEAPPRPEAPARPDGAPRGLAGGAPPAVRPGPSAPPRAVPPGWPGGSAPRGGPAPRRFRPADQMAGGRMGGEADGYGDDWPLDLPARQPVRTKRWVAAGALLVVLAATGGALAGRSDPASSPRWLGAPQLGATAPVLAGLGADAPRPVPAALSAKISSLLADARLGGRVSASIVDVTSGEPLYDRGGATIAVPASTAKLVTAAAVLQARGPGYRIPTRAVAGSAPGEVVLVGGGDPTLAAGASPSYPGAARLDELAEQVSKAVEGAPTRVVVDSSLYPGPTLGPGWFAADVKDGYISHITALMTDGARVNPKKVRPPSARYPQPDLAAGQIFARALGLPASAVSVGTAPPQAQQLGEVLSPPLSRLVEMMISDSDNIIAEALARQVALARDRPATFADAAAAIRDVIGDLGLPTEGYGLVDGSGLSHANRASAQLLTAVLAKAASHEFAHLRSIVSGLPVAAYSGTLDQRYRTVATGFAAAGVVRAKTGTLNGVNALAGMLVNADGRLLAFSIIADATKNSRQAEIMLDRIAAAIASCGC